MAQLGYTWYPKDWFTSTTRKRLKRFPLVRYAMRELFDLMYMEGGPIEMNKEYIYDDLDIDLNDKEYEKLLEYVDVMPDGKWWIDTVKKRISKAESARENGKKGGAKKGNQNARKTPKKTTQQPSKTTQQNNPNNPPSEREREREKESKREIKEKGKVNNARAIQFLNFKNQNEFETFEMQNKKLVKDWKSLMDNFNDTIDIEISQNKIEWEPDQLMPRLRKYTRAWINNQSKDFKNTSNQQLPKPPERY